MPSTRQPILRPRNIIILAIAAFLVAALYIAFAAQLATPGDSDRYVNRFAELLASAEPDDALPMQDAPTAWELATQAIELEHSIRTPRSGVQDQPFVDYSEIYMLPLAPEARNYHEPFTREEVVAHAIETIDLLREAGLFDLFAELAAARRLGRPAPDGPLTDDAIAGPISALRLLCRLNSARLHLAAHNGDWKEVADVLDQGLALAQLDAAGSTLTNHLNASSQHILLHSRLLAVLPMVPDEQTLQRIRAILDNRPPPSLARAFEGERLRGLDLIERTYTDGIRGGGRFIPTEFSRRTWPAAAGPPPPTGPLDRFENIVGFLVISKPAAKQAINDFYDDAVPFAALTLPQRQDSPFDPQAIYDGLTWRELPVGMALSGYVILRTPSLSQMLRDATELAIALETHRLRLGYYPSSLEALIPDILPQLPTDPAHGGTYGYRLLDEPDSELPYLIYSFGADGIDDGGTPAPSPTDALRPGEAPGTDFILSPQ